MLNSKGHHALLVYEHKKIYLFYNGSYQPNTLYHYFKRDPYERIRQLRLIVYHHNLHMWYRVVYIDICDIGVLLEVFFLYDINKIYDWALLAPGRPIRALAIGRVRSRRILRCSIISR
jgi:hypothetical protein